jgi:hypothetical protein
MSSLLSLPASARAQDGPSGNTAIAGGVGVSVGILGARVARRLGDLPFAVMVGLGLEGISPQLQIDLLSRGNFNLHVGGGVLYAPWEGLVLSSGSLLTVGTIGVQRWPYRWQHGGLFLNGDVEIVRQVRGISEGGHEHQWIPTVGGQVGVAF